MQQITITGNIGSDATLTQGEKQQYRFSVGVYNGKDQQGNSKTAWYTVFCLPSQWLEGRLFKGNKVTVTGNFKPDIFIGNDGSPRLDLTINAYAVEPHDFQQSNAVATPQRPSMPRPAAPAARPQSNNAYARASQPVGDLPNFNI